MKSVKAVPLGAASSRLNQRQLANPVLGGAARGTRGWVLRAGKLAKPLDESSKCALCLLQWGEPAARPGFRGDRIDLKPEREQTWRRGSSSKREK